MNPTCYIEIKVLKFKCVKYVTDKNRAKSEERDKAQNNFVETSNIRVAK